MKVKEIILHCSATPEKRNIKAKDIDVMHKQRGWKGIGYHYVIDLDGTIEKGRGENENGAHCVGHNSIALGICYIGGLDNKMKPKDTRTIEQKESLYKLVLSLMEKYNLRMTDIHCHYEFANKACPCFKIEDFINELNNYINCKKDE